MSNLIPEKRLDKNGRLVTKHVRADSGEMQSQRPLPAPALPVTPEQPTANLDFAGVQQKNKDFIDNPQPVMVQPADFAVFGDLMEEADKRDDDGMNKVYACSQIVGKGNIGGAHTILSYINEHEAGYDDHTLAFDAYRDGCGAGIFEVNKNYYADPEDKKYYEFVLGVIDYASSDYPVWDVGHDSYQSIAEVYHATGGSAPIDEVVDYWVDRGSLDAEGFVEFSDTHSPTREGVL